MVAGILFMKFVKKAEGAELCPNIAFWKALPFYIKVFYYHIIILLLCFSIYKCATGISLDLKKFVIYLLSKTVF